MPAILTNNLSVINAENFVDAFINGDSNLYMAVGRGYDDGDEISDLSKDDYEKWTDESNPPTPIDTINEQNNFRNYIIFYHPDYTVGYGISPYHAVQLQGSLAYDKNRLQPVGNHTPPRRMPYSTTLTNL